MKSILVSALFLSLLFAQAEAAYKCEINGRIVYQQLPCPDSGGEIELKTERPSGSGPIVSMKEKLCAMKTTCGQMRSCSDANYYYKNCGIADLDADNDGIPCEELCEKPKGPVVRNLPGYAVQQVNDLKKFLDSSFSDTRSDARRRICAIYRKHNVDGPNYCY